jgi:hypothetical protein
VNSVWKDKEIALNTEISTVIDEQGLCPDVTDDFLEKMEIYGSVQNDEYKIISIVAFPCVQNTPTSCDAVDLEEDYEMFFTSVKHSFRPYNKNEPYEVFVDMD